jgi:hypothetical protein
MMQGVAVGWQIYELTNDPFDLGLVGLVQFLPLVGFSVIIGQVADLYDRRLVVATCQVSKALAALALAVGTARGALSRDAMLAILFLSGTARAFEMPTIHALLPGIVSARLLPRAIAASASAQQTAVIEAPATLREGSTEVGYEHVAHAVYGAARHGEAQPANLAPDRRHGDARTPANRRGRNHRLFGAAPVRFCAGVAARPRAAARMRMSADRSMIEPAG